ncbi:hypothetical protein WA026_019494 [Henosepilachna vigintioctopunctata]|uniref:Uncharacterized protein n=1 Tax=Henosepilachna vigintioctopunctata TaxID=420089 RepID=A0AAW1TVI2_9CUCU
MKMITVHLLVLTCLLPVIICEEAITDPVDVLQINHLLLKNYHGKLNSKILKLFPNVEIFEIRNCNFTTVHDEFFHSIPKVRKLIVIDSSIKREDHDISSCCWKLKEIDFINAGFDIVPWHKMGSHWPLERMYLYKEIVPHLKEKFFENKHLKNLTIENANLENIEDSAFQGLIKH